MSEEEKMLGRTLETQPPSVDVGPKPTPSSDERLVALYARVCRDSGYGLSVTNAAIIAARAAGRHPLDVWVALGLNRMQRIASGSVPVSGGDAKLSPANPVDATQQMTQNGDAK